MGRYHPTLEEELCGPLLGSRAGQTLKLNALPPPKEQRVFPLVLWHELCVFDISRAANSRCQVREARN